MRILGVVVREVNVWLGAFLFEILHLSMGELQQRSRPQWNAQLAEY